MHPSARLVQDVRLWAVFSVIGLLGCSGAPAQQSPAPTFPPGPSSAPSTTATGQPTPTSTHQRTPKPTDEGESWLGGTITWTASGTDGSTPPTTQSVTGTAYVVIHVIDPYLLLAERDTGNTYSYDYTSNRDDCPSTHEEGTLESQAGVGTTDPWDYSIGTLNPSGPTGEDLSLTIAMPDYCGPSMGGNVDTQRGFLEGFPDCEPSGDQLFARFDGVDSYVIDCDVIGYGGANEFVGTASGHVSGTLSPLDGPQN
ncbi:MAG: hypothetical protein ABI725_01060 [Chloroflexota bacterium]